MENAPRFSNQLNEIIIFLSISDGLNMNQKYIHIHTVLLYLNKFEFTEKGLQFAQVFSFISFAHTFETQIVSYSKQLLSVFFLCRGFNSRSSCSA